MPTIPPPPVPPPLLYANNSTDVDETRTCPPWLAVVWLTVLLVSGWFSLRTMVEQYDDICDPMAAWLNLPATRANPNGNPFFNPQPQQSTVPASEFLGAALGTCVFCFLFAATATASLWHWPRPMLWLLLLFPLVAVVWYLLAPPSTQDQMAALIHGYPSLVRHSLSTSQRWSTVPPHFSPRRLASPSVC